jgi:uncharacterized RDD family membrane protein YckC
MLRGMTTEEPSQRPEASGAPQRRRSLPARLLGFGASRAQRAAEVTGIDRTLQLAAEEAIVRAVQSPAVERALGRVLSGPVVQQAAEDAVQSRAVERALVETLDSEMVDRIWARILSSEETQKLIERIAEAPELRAAIASQGVGLIDDLGDEVSETTRRLDDLVERVFWWLARRGRREVQAPQAGAVTRLVAFAIDVGLLSGLFFIVSALLGLVLSGLFFEDSSSALVAAVGAGAWILAGSLYLAGFWALEGQTPGMRFLNIRLDSQGSRKVGWPVAWRRLRGFILSTLMLGLGFLGILLSSRRRGLPDRIADTEVLYMPDEERAPWRRPLSGGS